MRWLVATVVLVFVLGGRAQAQDVPTFAKVVSMHSNKRCFNAQFRDFRVRLTWPLPIESADVFVRGRLKQHVTGHDLNFPIVVDVPTGRFTVKVRVKMASGETLRGSRRYRTCPRRPVLDFSAPGS
jgi:hypothetical protein